MNSTLADSVKEIQLPLVSVVIPTYNRKEALAREIQSILHCDYPHDRLEITVIDDACTDGTYHFIREKFDKIQVLRNDVEKGLAACRNIGIKKSCGDLIFVIDDDNVVDKSAITELVMAIRSDDNLGMVAPLMLYLNSPNRIWCACVKRNYATSITTFPYRDRTLEASLPKIMESDDFPNAFMVKRSMITNIGLLDENNFVIHYDEADFGIRARRAGFKIAGISSARIWHDIPLPEEEGYHAISWLMKFQLF